jgi:LDH2 family malate/lactate/ureidoglycolate dehydrogenase
MSAAATLTATLSGAADAPREEVVEEGMVGVGYCESIALVALRGACHKFRKVRALVFTV